MDRTFVSHPDHSSGPGCNQRPHVAHVYKPITSTGVNVGFVNPSFLHHRPTAPDHECVRNMSSITIPRQRLGQRVMNGGRTHHHCPPDRRSKVRICGGYAGSFEGARSERNAEYRRKHSDATSSWPTPTTQGCLFHQFLGALREPDSGCRYDPRYPPTNRNPTNTTADNSAYMRRLQPGRRWSGLV